MDKVKKDIIITELEALRREGYELEPGSSAPRDVPRVSLGSAKHTALSLLKVGTINELLGRMDRTEARTLVEGVLSPNAPEDGQ